MKNYYTRTWTDTVLVKYKNQTMVFNNTELDEIEKEISLILNKN